MLKSAAPSPRIRLRATPFVLFVTAMVLAVVVHVGATGQLPFVHRENVWSVSIYEGDSPFELRPGQETPVLTAEDVTDVPALFVADPFMIEHQDTWHMFFEVLNQRSNHGDIGWAVRQRNGNWQYQQIILDEPTHLSYPQVIHWQDQIYMIPESAETGEVRLYRANPFPTHWEQVETLVHRERIADPTVFRWHDRWWMFAGRSHTHDQLLLFYADELTGPWIEHIDSPVVVSDPSIARPGGHVFEYEGQLYRLGQDCVPRYGSQLRAFRITSLTTNSYLEEPVSAGTVLTAGTASWNRVGMHHCDLHPTSDGRWTAAVDGHAKQWNWRFGLPN